VIAPNLIWPRHWTAICFLLARRRMCLVIMEQSMAQSPAANAPPPRF